MSIVIISYYSHPKVDKNKFLLHKSQTLVDTLNYTLNSNVCIYPHHCNANEFKFHGFLLVFLLTCLLAVDWPHNNKGVHDILW